MDTLHWTSWSCYSFYFLTFRLYRVDYLNRLIPVLDRHYVRPLTTGPPTTGPWQLAPWRLVTYEYIPTTFFVVLSSGLCCTTFAKSFAWALGGFNFWVLLSTVYVLSSRDETYSRHSCVLNPGPLGENCKCYLCTVQPPSLIALSSDFSSFPGLAALWMFSHY